MLCEDKMNRKSGERENGHSKVREFILPQCYETISLKRVGVSLLRKP